MSQDQDDLPFLEDLITVCLALRDGQGPLKILLRISGISFGHYRQFVQNFGRHSDGELMLILDLLRDRQRLYQLIEDQRCPERN